MKKIRELAETEALDSESMPANEFLVAEENNSISGFGRVIQHQDCLELCSLMVIKEKRRQGIGRKITAARIKKALDLSKGGPNIYITTIIPQFFEKSGFKQAKIFPKSMIKDEKWCQGCKDRTRCVVMKYEHS